MDTRHHYHTATSAAASDFPVERVALVAGLSRALVARWAAGTLPDGLHALLSERISRNADVAREQATYQRWQAVRASERRGNYRRSVARRAAQGQPDA